MCLSEKIKLYSLVSVCVEFVPIILHILVIIADLVYFSVLNYEDVVGNLANVFFKILYYLCSVVILAVYNYVGYWIVILNVIK